MIEQSTKIILLILDHKNVLNRRFAWINCHYYFKRLIKVIQKVSDKFCRHCVAYSEKKPPMLVLVPQSLNLETDCQMYLE